VFHHNTTKTRCDVTLVSEFNLLVGEFNLLVGEFNILVGEFNLLVGEFNVIIGFRLKEKLTHRPKSNKVCEE